MNRSAIVVIVIVFHHLLAFQLIAGGENRLAGGRSAALGNASIAISDVWSAFNNQAGLASLGSPTAGIYYENRFLVKELGYNAVAFAYPMKSGTIAVSYSYFGFSAYNESKTGVAFAKGINRFISFGVQLDYFSLHQDEPYGNNNFVTFEAGLTANITPQLTLGAHAFNPINASLSETSGERAPSALRVGALYKASDFFAISAEAEKNINHKVVLKTGIEYKVAQAVQLRLGISSNPSLFSFGTGIHYKNLLIDISAAYHQVLGFSPQTSVAYVF